MDQRQKDSLHMQRAIAIAWRGQGLVEPNPMVGCVIVKGSGPTNAGNAGTHATGPDEVIGEGWHQQFGHAHAEINAIAAAQSAGHTIARSTLYVTLEPCSHHGKTGPCADALIEAGVARVVVGVLDPNPDVSGTGVRRLQQAGIEVVTGVEVEEATNCLAPYLKRTTQQLPWVIAKWAMTIDGKIATFYGDSQWISNPHSRDVVQTIRGRVDGIMVGATTALNDDPALTARGEKLRTPTRIVVDSKAGLRLNSNLVSTAKDIPTILVTSRFHDYRHAKKIGEAGVEVWVGQHDDPDARLLEFLKEFAARGATNLMVEGGGRLLGSLYRLRQIDEAHVFVGPKLLGGRNSISPVQGEDPVLMESAQRLSLRSVRRLQDDVYMQYRRRVENHDS